MALSPTKGDCKGLTPTTNTGRYSSFMLSPTKGDRKGPHPAPHLPRPY